jgi:tripartite ATP-independent transporter DctM subunit
MQAGAATQRTARYWGFVIMILICADVVGLKLFSAPIYGVVEFTAQSIVAIVFMQLAYGLHTGRMVRADFLISWLEKAHPFRSRLFEIVFAVFGFCVFAILARALALDFHKAYVTGEYFGIRSMFNAPVWPFKLLTAIGAVAVVVEFLLIGLLQTQAALRGTVGQRARFHDLAWAIALVVVILSPLVVAEWFAPDRITIGLLGVALLLILIIAGMHIPVALCVIAGFSIWVIRDNPDVAIRTLRSAATGTIDKFEFGVVPLFVLMGLLTDISEIGRDAYKVAAWWTRKIIGGLGVATVMANAVFAAVTGISLASAAVFSKLAVPEMSRHGYRARFAAGTVAGSSVLGMLIPPSLLLIIYGFVTETSVGALFLAAIVPGLILAGIFCCLIMAMARFSPSLVGEMSADVEVERETLASSLAKLAPISVLVLVVLGGIYLGWFTPTQAGAIGAFAALVLTFIRGKLNLSTLWSVLKETGQISVSVLFLIIAASAFSKGIVMSTLPSEALGFVTQNALGFWTVIAGYVLIVVIMGMFLDSASIIVIAVPLVLEVVRQLGAPVVGPDILIWFGILTVVAVEIGLLTPPFGLTVYVVKATIRDACSLKDIFIGAAPFVAGMALLVVLLMAFPGLSLVFL